MAHLFRYLTVFFVSAFILTATPRAQPAPPADRQIVFTVFSAQPISGWVYAPQPRATPVPLVFYPTSRSPKYFYRGPSRMRIFHGATGELMADVSVPPHIRTALLIFFPRDTTGSGDLRYRVEVVDDGPARQEAGTLMFLNLSELDLAGTVNQRSVTLRKGFNEPIRVSGAPGIELRTLFNGRSYQAYAETIPFAQSGRCLVLLLPPYRRGSLEVQSRVLVDFPASAGPGSNP